MPEQQGISCLAAHFCERLANSGVASELRQRLVGHSDSGVHKKYTHLEFQVLRDAVARIPSIRLALHDLRRKGGMAKRMKRKPGEDKAPSGATPGSEPKAETPEISLQLRASAEILSFKRRWV